MRLPGFLLLGLIVCAPARAQVPLPTQGTVTRVGDPVEVDLEGSAEAAIGARVLTLRTVDIGGREVGVLTGVYRVIRVEWPIVTATADPEASGGLPGAARGDRASLETFGDPSELAILSEPEDARIFWNGHALGTTGDTLTVAPGDYTFTFEKADYEPASFDFSVPVGQIRRETVSLDQAAGGGALFASARAKFAGCEYEDARDLVREAISAGLPAAEQPDAFVLLRAMEQATPLVVRAGRMGASADAVCAAGSALHLLAKAEASGDATVRGLACADLRGALPDDPFVRQTCPQ